LMASRKVIHEDNFNYRLQVQKIGLSRFLPHQASVTRIDRAFGRIKIPVVYSKGFSPKPRIASVGALPLGLESVCEELIVEVRTKLDVTPEFLKELNHIFPDGMKIISLEEVENRKPRLPLSISYSYDTNPEEIAVIEDRYANDKIEPVVNHRAKKIDVVGEINKVTIEPAGVEFTLNCNEQGSATSPFLVLGALLDIKEKDARLLRVRKVRNNYASV
jgi:radical SAM-linked protein